MLVMCEAIIGPTSKPRGSPWLANSNQVERSLSLCMADLLILGGPAAEKPSNGICGVWYERALQHRSGSVVERAFRNSKTGLDTVLFDEKLWEKGAKRDHA